MLRPRVGERRSKRLVERARVDWRRARRGRCGEARERRRARVPRDVVAELLNKLTTTTTIDDAEEEKEEKEKEDDDDGSGGGGGGDDDDNDAAMMDGGGGGEGCVIVDSLFLDKSPRASCLVSFVRSYSSADEDDRPRSSELMVPRNLRVRDTHAHTHMNTILPRGRDAAMPPLPPRPSHDRCSESRKRTNRFSDAASRERRESKTHADSSRHYLGIDDVAVPVVVDALHELVVRGEQRARVRFGGGRRGRAGASNVRGFDRRRAPGARGFPAVTV